MATTGPTAETMTAQGATPTLSVDGEGIGWLVFDDPERPVNLLTSTVMQRLDAVLDEVEAGVRDDRVRALVIRSGKPGAFIAGADVDEIASIRDAEDAARKARTGQRVFTRIDRLEVPTIAVIDGACIGGGTELALVCDHRLASDREETRIGLAEVRIGIIPGFGGTVRLPRLIGLRAALDMILTGRPVPAKKAQRTGLVDEVVPAPVIVDRAARLARERIRSPEHRPRGSQRGLLSRIVEGSRLGRRLVLRIAERRVRRETRGHYPAPLVAIETLRDTLGRPIDEALEREAEATGRLIVSAECKNLIHVFHLLQDAKKAAPAAEPRPVARAAVLGAGVMGGGIAQLLAYHDIPVRVKDIREEAIGEALRHARGLFDKAVRRRKLEVREAERRMGEIEPTLEYTGFGTADVVVEAVVERMDVKKAVLREAEEHAAADTVLASNTSALSISEMQQAIERPEALCGMHFFNPVHRMPLVEIVRGAATSEDTVSTVFALALRLGKTPVIVSDGPGFVVNRLLSVYLNEAAWLLDEGVRFERIDEALVEFGMPMGPFRLLDEVGLDVAAHVAEFLHEAFGERLRPAPPLARLDGTGRLGRKGGRGFYRYEEGEEKGVDAEVYEQLGTAAGTTGPDRSAEEIVERTIFVMINEAARTLEDEIVATPAAIDVAMITGTGFPPFRGGLLRYADTLGSAAVERRLDQLARTLGGRYQPAALLQEIARDDSSFYAEVDGLQPGGAPARGAPPERRAGD